MLSIPDLNTQVLNVAGAMEAKSEVADSAIGLRPPEPTHNIQVFTSVEKPTKAHSAHPVSGVAEAKSKGNATQSFTKSDPVISGTMATSKPLTETSARVVPSGGGAVPAGYASASQVEALQGALQDSISTMHAIQMATHEANQAKLEAFISFTTDRLDAIEQIVERLDVQLSSAK